MTLMRLVRAVCLSQLYLFPFLSHFPCSILRSFLLLINFHSVSPTQNSSTPLSFHSFLSLIILSLLSRSSLLPRLRYFSRTWAFFSSYNLSSLFILGPSFPLPSPRCLFLSSVSALCLFSARSLSLVPCLFSTRSLSLRISVIRLPVLWALVP